MKDYSKSRERYTREDIRLILDMAYKEDKTQPQIVEALREAGRPGSLIMVSRIVAPNVWQGWVDEWERDNPNLRGVKRLDNGPKFRRERKRDDKGTFI